MTKTIWKTKHQLNNLIFNFIYFQNHDNLNKKRELTIGYVYFKNLTFWNPSHQAILDHVVSFAFGFDISTFSTIMTSDSV